MASWLRTTQEAGIHAFILIMIALWAFRLYPSTGQLPATFQKLDRLYSSIDKRLNELAVPLEDTIMTTDPFFLHYYCRRPAVLIPHDQKPRAIADATDRYTPPFLVCINFKNKKLNWTEDEYRIGKVVFKAVTDRTRTEETSVSELNITGYRIFEVFWKGSQ